MFLGNDFQIWLDETQNVTCVNKLSYSTVSPGMPTVRYSGDTIFRGPNSPRARYSEEPIVQGPNSPRARYSEGRQALGLSGPRTVGPLGYWTPEYRALGLLQITIALAEASPLHPRQIES